MVGVQASVYSPLFKHVWIVVLCCIQASVSSPLIKHVWIVVPCCIQASVSSPVFQTRLDYGSVSVYKNLSPAPLIKHIWIVAPCCVQASVSTRVSNTFCGSWSVYIISLQPFVSNTFDLGFLFVYPPAHTKMRTPELEKFLHRVRAPNPLLISWSKSNYLE